jgi:hypothetical protein
MWVKIYKPIFLPYIEVVGEQYTKERV